MGASRFDFVNDVVARRDLVVTSSHAHACRLEPRESELAWHCDLDDGTPTDTDRDPAADVRWVCPEFRIGVGARGTDVVVLDVHQAGPHSDLGRLLQGLGRLVGRPSRRTTGGDVEERYVYTDPAGVLDAALRQRLEQWPQAPHGDGVVRPAQLWSVKVNREGLIVNSVSWWDSAPALDHQIGLALDIAHRLIART